jgi:hypothetical protein
LALDARGKQLGHQGTTVGYKCPSHPQCHQFRPVILVRFPSVPLDGVRNLVREHKSKLRLVLQDVENAGIHHHAFVGVAHRVEVSCFHEIKAERNL